jgi:hypothetical protein
MVMSIDLLIGNTHLQTFVVFCYHSRALYRLRTSCFATFTLFCLLVLPSCDFVSKHHLHEISFRGVAFMQFCFWALPSFDFI